MEFDHVGRLKELTERVDELKEKGLESVKPLQSCCSIVNCTPNNATQMVTDAISGFDKANFFHSLSLSLQGRAAAFMKAMESIAYLDLAADTLTVKGVKDTAEARKRVSEQNSDVIAAKELSSRVDALESFFKNEMQKFRMAYDALKKAGMNDPSVGDNRG